MPHPVVCVINSMLRPHPSVVSMAPPQELLLLAVPPDVVEPIARGRIVARKLDEVRTRTRTRTLTCACRCTLDVRTHTGASTHHACTAAVPWEC